MVPVAEQGASTSVASKGGGVEGEGVGDDDVGVQFQPLEIGGEHLQPLGRSVDGGDRGARRGQFGALAAGRRAEVDDALSGMRAEKPRRQRGGGVLHPPFALRIAFELGDREMRIEAHRACRENDAAEALGPACGIALDAEVERRLAAVRRGDGARRFVAVSRAPARREPVRRVVVERVRGGEDGRAIARDSRAGRR